MPAITRPPARATLDDLLRFAGRAELVNGRLVELMGNGFLPGQFSNLIWLSLFEYAQHRGGYATSDGVIFAIPPLPNGRETFLPDAAYYSGPLTDTMDVIRAAPTFAVEVRSKRDYGPAADRECALKRADYFAAGALVVWDVGPVAGVISCYAAADPLASRRFGPGEVADAEPAVPGWRLVVDWLLRPSSNRNSEQL